MQIHAHTIYRLAIGLSIFTMLLLVWLSLGVGIIGADGDPANLMYFGILVIGLVGSVIVKLQPLGMARTLFVMALVQALMAVIASILGLGKPYSGAAEILLLNGFFVAMFGISGWLFLVQHDLNRERR